MNTNCSTLKRREIFHGTFTVSLIWSVLVGSAFQGLTGRILNIEIKNKNSDSAHRALGIGAEVKGMLISTEDGGTSFIRTSQELLESSGRVISKFHIAVLWGVHD